MSGAVIPNTYAGSAPGVASFNEGFAVVWKRPGSSGKIWWGSFQPQLKFNVWLTHGLTHEVADTDTAPAIAQIPGTNHLIVAWKGTGFFTEIYYSVFDGSLWSEPKSAGSDVTRFGPSLTVFNGSVYLAWTGSGDNIHLSRYIPLFDLFEQEATLNNVLVGSRPALAAAPFQTGIRNSATVIYAAYIELGSQLVSYAVYNGSWIRQFNFGQSVKGEDVSAAFTEQGVCIAWKQTEDQYPAAVTDPGATCQEIHYCISNGYLDHLVTRAQGVYSDFAPGLYYNRALNQVEAVWQKTYPLRPLVYGNLKGQTTQPLSGTYLPGMFGTFAAAAPDIYDAYIPPNYSGSGIQQVGLYAINQAGEVWAYREASNSPYNTRLLKSGVYYPNSPVVMYAESRPTDNYVTFYSVCERDGAINVFTQGLNDDWSIVSQIMKLPPGSHFAVDEFQGFYAVDQTGTLMYCRPGATEAGPMSAEGFAPPGCPIGMAHRSDDTRSYGSSGEGPLNLFLVANDGALWVFEATEMVYSAYTKFTGGTKMPGIVRLLPGSFVACGFQTAMAQQVLENVETGTTQLDVFVIDEDGQMQLWWESQGSGWTQQPMGPRANGLVPGGPIAIGAQLWKDMGSTGIQQEQLDIFSVDAGGSLRVWFVYQSTNWDETILAPAGTYYPGTHLCTAAQGVDDSGVPHQLDLFIVSKSGDLMVYWVYDAGTWNLDPMTTT